MACPYEGIDCECFGEVVERHRNTSFVYSDEDKLSGKPDPNKMISCESHYQLDYDRYQEMWEDYWRGRL